MLDTLIATHLSLPTRPRLRLVAELSRRILDIEAGKTFIAITTADARIRLANPISLRIQRVIQLQSNVFDTCAQDDNLFIVGHQGISQITGHGDLRTAGFENFYIGSRLIGAGGTQVVLFDGLNLRYGSVTNKFVGRWSKAIPESLPVIAGTHSRVAVGATPGRIEVFDVRSGKVLKRITYSDFGPLATISYSRDNWLSLFTRKNWYVRFDSSGRKVANIRLGTVDAPQIAVTGLDGEQIALADDSGIIRLVNALNGRIVGSFELDAVATCMMAVKGGFLIGTLSGNLYRLSS